MDMMHSSASLWSAGTEAMHKKMDATILLGTMYVGAVRANVDP